MRKQRVFYKWFVNDPSEDKRCRYLLIDRNTEPFTCISGFNDEDIDRISIIMNGRQNLEIIERERAADKYNLFTIDIVSLKC